MRIMDTNGKIVLDKWYTCHHWCQNIISMGKRAFVILINNAVTNMPSAGKEKKRVDFPHVRWWVTGMIWDVNGWESLAWIIVWFEMNNII